MLPGLMSVGVGGAGVSWAKTTRGASTSTQDTSRRFMKSLPFNLCGGILQRQTVRPLPVCDSIQVGQAADEDGPVGHGHRGERRAVELVHRELLKGLAWRDHRCDTLFAEKVDAAVGENR